MQATARRLTAEPLAWDSAHFGVPVCRIEIDGDASGLPDALARAEGDGLAWIYVFTPPDFAMPAEWLERFDGLKVDTRVVFRREFSDGEPVEPESHADSVIVAEAPVGRPSPALVELATAAGAFSRFGVDPRIPEDAFRRLYEIWITRSCLHETADAVLTAEDRGAPGVPMGLMTIAARDGAATIGLVAVSPAARRRGVGRAMMRRAHGWLAARGIRRASVTTQEANEPACALYRACGYQAGHRESIYHFRPRSAARS